MKLLNYKKDLVLFTSMAYLKYTKSLTNFFLELRPLCSRVSSCISKLSEFVDAFLKPSAQQNPSYNTSKTLVQEIETDVVLLVTHSKTFLVTMDVSSLYPNIDHQEGSMLAKLPSAHVLRNQSQHQSSAIYDNLKMQYSKIRRTFLSSNQRHTDKNPYGRKSG